MSPLERRRARRPDPPGRVRVTLGPAADSPDLTSLWAVRSAGEGGAVVFTLEHDYEDFRPSAGWHLAVGGEVFRVDAADGRRLTCAPEGGGE